jgi:hypothetical protein
MREGVGMSASVAIKSKLARKNVEKKKGRADAKRGKDRDVGLSATELTRSVASNTGTRTKDGDVFLELPRYDQDDDGRQICSVIRFRIPEALLKAEEFFDASISSLIESDRRRWGYFTGDHQAAIFDTQDDAECAALRAGYDVDEFVVRQISEEYLPTRTVQ